MTNLIHRLCYPVFAIVAVSLISACAKLPVHKSGHRNKNLEIPKRYDATQPPVPEVVSGLLTIFSDARMRSYVDTALKKNPDLRESAARLEEAGFNTKVARSAALPTLTANASGVRSQRTAFSAVSGMGNIFSTSLDAAWELDVWGRIRAGITAASSDRSAAAADYEAAKQSIAAQTMQAYFNLVATEKLLSLANRRFASFQKTQQLVDRRFERGVSNLGDVDLARDAKHQAYSWPSLQRSVPAGIPSDVLMKRPDIDAAYQRIRAADARVKVAHRDLYPNFSLTGSVGRQSSMLSQLADSNFNVWSFGGSIAAPLLDGGNRRAELGASNARAKQALASYQSIVLNAFREVEDALGSELYLRRQQSAHESALKAARRAEAGSRRNYEQGVVEILTLLESQRRSFDTEELLINTQSLRYQNRVSLALALGKGL